MSNKIPTKYSDAELKNNYADFIRKLHVIFEGSPKLDGLLKLYGAEGIGNNLILAPAANRPYYGYAYEGGYIDHVNLVAHLALKFKSLFESNGGTVNFEDKELLFVAINQNVGFLGEEEIPYYLPESNNWAIEGKKQYFDTNSNIEWMKHVDRTFYLLQKYNIPMTKNEYMGIRLQDGLYDEANREYLIRYAEDTILRRNIVHIIRQANELAAVIERDNAFISE